jgi:CDP-6-deoxy-D-xylo-4-hexulose-3-dehydrase
MTLEAEIRDFLTNVGNNHQIFKYLYNTTPDTFVPFDTPVYYSGPYWDNQEIVALMKAILEGKWITSGEMVHKFEAQFSKKFKLNHSVMVNSGSSANLALIGAVKKYLDWQDGDEIILSVVGFPTTLAPLLQNNLKPVFIDIELDSLKL